jgi:hypothetical protein
MKQFAIGCALVLAACSDDTGILVEVHGDEVQADIVRLDTMVIVDDGNGSVPSDVDWGGAERISADVTIDLKMEPYTVMLRPEGGLGDGAAVWVSALAYDAENNLVGWGELGTSVTFRSDLVKRVELDLHGASVVGGGCVVKDGVVVVRNADDCDSDTFKYDVDCDDLDAQIGGDTDGDPVVCDPDCDQTSGEIYPGADEVCDGVDNDCDELTHPPPELCVQVTRDDAQNVIECRVGERVCNDSTGTSGLCVSAPIDPVENGELCSYWGDCIDAGGDVNSCLVDAGMYCKVQVADSGEACLAAVTPTKLSDYFSITDCLSWSVVGNVQQGPWNVGLRQVGSSSGIASFYDGCDAELVVTGAGTLAHVMVLEVDTGFEFLDYAVVLDPRRSGCDPSHGSDLECSVAP